MVWGIFSLRHGAPSTGPSHKRLIMKAEGKGGIRARMKGERVRKGRDWKDREERKGQQKGRGWEWWPWVGPYLLLCRGWDSRKGTMGVCFGGRLRDWAWPGVAGAAHLEAGRELWEAGPLHCHGALLR